MPYPVASAAEEQNASMEEIAASARTLSDMAEELRAVLKTLRITKPKRGFTRLEPVNRLVKRDG